MAAENSSPQEDKSHEPKQAATHGDFDILVRLKESFARIYKGPDAVRHEYELELEAQKVGIDLEKFRYLYNLHSKPKTPLRRIGDWTGFQEKKLWDFLSLLIVPAVLSLGAFYLQEAAKQRESRLAEDKARQETLNKYFDTMLSLIFDRDLK